MDIPEGAEDISDTMRIAALCLTQAHKGAHRGVRDIPHIGHVEGESDIQGHIRTPLPLMDIYGQKGRPSFANRFWVYLNCSILILLSKIKYKALCLLKSNSGVDTVLRIR